MSATVSMIAERVLRRLGVSVVPVADRPVISTRTAPGDIATAALIALGVIATDAVPPSQATVVATDTIATLALVKLAVIASDETPAAADMTLARDTIASIHANLVAAGNADWPLAGITTAVAEEYAALGAVHMATSFGKAGDLQAVAALEARIANVARIARAYDLALTKVNEVQATLISQGVVSWDNLGIPTALAEEYTRLVAADLASSFGQQTDPKMIAALEARVRRVALIMRAPQDAEEAVMSVHDSMAARGLARWSVFDIHAAAEMPYELLAANRLAALYDKPADPQAEILAVRQLAQIVALGTSGIPVYGEYY